MPDDNIVLTQALQYAEQGFPVFPVHKMQNGVCTCYRGETCASPGKHPTVDGWPELATTDTAQITTWFTKVYKGHNIGVYLGNSLLCIDVDIKEEQGKDGQAKLDKLQAKLGQLPTGGNIQKTASGGTHYLYRIKSPLGRHVSKDPASPYYGLDILSGNSFIVAAPSRTNKGAYTWISCENTLPTMTEIPELPEVWHKELQNVCSIPVSSGKDRDGQKAQIGLVTKVMKSLPERDINFGVDDETFDKLEAALSWIPASGWEESNSWFKILGAIKLAACDQRGLNLACEWSASTNEQGQTAAEYQGDDDVAYHWSRCSAPMDSAPDDASYTSIFYYAEKFGYPKNGQAKHVTVDSQTGELVTEFMCARLDDTGIEATMPDTVDIIDVSDNMVDADFFAQYQQEKIEPPACLTEGTAMVGVLSDIQAYIESRNPSPQPLLAALASFATLSTLTRRSYCGCPALKNTRTNLMGIAVAPSGGGKDASLKGGSHILRHCDLKDTIGRESKSGSAYHSQLMKSPNLYFAQDEIGKWWQYTQGNATHANTIKTFFLKAFTSSDDGHFVGVEYAGMGKANNIEEVEFPHVNLFGVTTPQTFYDSLTMADLHEGLIGRTLIVESGTRPKLKTSVVEDKASLDAVLRYNKDLTEHLMKGNTESIGGYAVDDPVLVQVTPDAADMINDAVDKIRTQMMPKLDGMGLAEVYGRWGELVNKLACLMAIAKDCKQPTVTKIEATFAMQIVDYCCAKWVSIFASSTINETLEAGIKKRIVEHLTAHPRVKLKDKSTGEEVFAPMTEGRLRNRLSIKKHDYDSALTSLIEGDVVRSTVIQGARGKATNRVWLKGQPDPEAEIPA